MRRRRSEPFIERDTLAIGKESSHRRLLLGLDWIDPDRLVGRDVEAYPGMLVRMTEDGRKRRELARKGGGFGPTAAAWKARDHRDHGGRSGAGEAREEEGEQGLGTIVGVHGNWTCDVKWKNGVVATGYACGSHGGKKGRAFHLKEVPLAPLPKMKVSSRYFLLVCCSS